MYTSTSLKLYFFIGHVVTKYNVCNLSFSRDTQKEQLRSSLTKIAATVENGSVDEASLSRNVKLVLAANSNTPKYKRPVVKSSQEQKTALPKKKVTVCLVVNNVMISYKSPFQMHSALLLLCMFARTTKAFNKFIIQF
jgi:hypothetical protein